MSQYVLLLSDLSYMMGIIGAAEYEERLAIVNWLDVDSRSQYDPRSNEIFACEPSGQCVSETESGNFERHHGGHFHAPNVDSAEVQLEYCALGTWVFTLGDRDCYPSVPHGHEFEKAKKWPKLNPYTGRVFVAPHTEDVSRRLGRTDMISLWNDHSFVHHCR